MKNYLPLLNILQHFYAYFQWIHGINMQLQADFEPLLTTNFPKLTSISSCTQIFILTFQDYTQIIHSF